MDLRPAWRNVNGAAQTFAGRRCRASPVRRARPTTHHRRRRRLRHRGHGATAACTDCYRRVRRPARPRGRPTHWDATFAGDASRPTRRARASAGALHVGEQLHRRAAIERLLPLRRDAAAPRRHRRLRRHGVTARAPSTTREQMAVFVLAGEGGRGLRAAALRAARVRRRAGLAAPSAAGSRSWRAAAWRAAAAAATTARPPRSRASRWRCSCCARWTRALDPPACTTPDLRRRARVAARSAAGSRSWRGAAWWPAAAAGTTARPAPGHARADGRVPDRARSA